MGSFVRNLIPRLVLHQEATEMLCRERQNKSRRQVTPLPADTNIVEPPTINIEVPLATSDTESTSAPPITEASSYVDASASPEEQAPSSKKQARSPDVDADVETPSTPQPVADIEAPAADHKSDSSTCEVVETESSDFDESPSIDIPSLLRTKAEKVAKRTVNEIVSLPHEASRSWVHLSLIIMLHALGPVVLAVVPVFMMRLPSVNEGLSHNRGFLYGIHTFVELFIIVAFIQTCHFGIPSAEIPVMARATAILVGLVVGKGLLAFIAEAWWSRHADPVFPIPFSFIVTAVISLPLSLWTLRLMTPKRKEPAVLAKFNLCFSTLAAYMLSLFVVGLWGVVFRRLQVYPKWQSVWGLTFQLFEFVCKIPLVVPLVTRLNSKRWIQLSLVVDLIFVSVHTAVLPYFASYATVIISLVGTLFSLIWRAYSGVDRVMITAGLFWRMLTKPNSDSPEVVIEELGARGFKIPTVIARASIKDIHQLSMRLHGNGAARSFQEWEEASNDPDEPMDEIKRSSTEETENLYDCDSVDSPVDVEDPEESGTPEPVTTSADLSVEPQEEESKVMIDRRQAFANFRFRNSRHSKLTELDWKQRQCYHVVDSVSSAVLSIVVRLAGLIISSLVRGLPVSEHLNASFQISDDQWHTANIYGWMFLIGTVGVLLVMSMYLIRLNLGGLTLNRVISYMFRDHFWFFFFWFCITKALAIAMMLNHYGADFTLDFDWLSCRGEGRMAWPGCVPLEPSSENMLS